MAKEKYCIIDGSRVRFFELDDGYSEIDKSYYCRTCGFEYDAGLAEEDVRCHSILYFRALKFDRICSIFEEIRGKPREHLPDKQKKALEEMASDFGKWVSRFR